MAEIFKSFNMFSLFSFSMFIVFVANPVSDRNPVETKVEVKNEFRSETKPVVISAASQQSTHVTTSIGK